MNRPLVPVVSRHFHRLAWFAAILAFCVIVFGAFVRLSNAGLSCPDWPTCYGQAAWPKTVEDAASHAASNIRQFDDTRAWREQVHRQLAGGLGVLVFILAIGAVRKRAKGILQVVGASALVAISIFFYMKGAQIDALTPEVRLSPESLPWFEGAAVLAGIGELILLFAAWRWSNSDLSRIAVLTLAMIIVQALLGMWTVTWLLKPIVVMSHLLGGFTTFALLVWMAWRATNVPINLADAQKIRVWVVVGLVVLGIQIALGGWTSSNYAALSCGAGKSLAYFPKCAGQWWPDANFSEGFVLWRGIGVDYEGGVLDGASRIGIQLVHRVMAVVVFLYLWVLALKFMRMPGMRGWGTTIALLVSTQVCLGIANIVYALPLKVAVAHNGVAALLLFALVSLLARLQSPIEASSTP
jgi:cytochrome c oxidase assembly protein subunit 15